MRMKKIMILLLAPLATWGQPAVLRLTDAYELARQHYPVIRQQNLLQRSSALQLANLQKNWWPQISFSAQGSYQSDVTQVKIPLPGITIDPLSRDQYRAVAELNQLLYDGGATREMKAVQRQTEKVEQQQLETELYALRERINQLFLGILWLDEQQQLVSLVDADLQTGLRKVEALVNNGVAFRSNQLLLQAEILKNEQRAIELRATRKGLLEVLALLINQPLTAQTVLEMPAPEDAIPAPALRRPELELFNRQQQLLQLQERLTGTRTKPRAGVFFQGGYGRPGLNMLQNEFSFYYTTGLRLSWQLSNFYTHRNEKQQLNLQREMIGNRATAFELNTRTLLSQQQAEISKQQELTASDSAIIRLRRSVKEAARAQLENGVISANDYLREVNAEDQARQSLLNHRLQLLQAAINLKTTEGKL